MLVVGCKKDLLEETKSDYMKVNSRVQDVLKKIDKGRQIDYIEVGLSQHKMVYRVPDIISYIGKLFDDCLPVVEEGELPESMLNLSMSSVSESSDCESAKSESKKGMLGGFGTAFSSFIKNGGLP